jgi:hypothetical protein
LIYNVVHLVDLAVVEADGQLLLKVVLLMSFAALLAAAVAVVAGEDGGGGVGVAGLGVETSSLCYGWALIFSCAPPPLLLSLALLVLRMIP